MPSRSQMDHPAMVASTVLGVALIAAGLAGILLGGAAADDYLVTWSEADAGEASQASAASGATASVSLGVADAIPATATIEFDPCADSAQEPVQQPATIRWTLRWEDHEETGTASCDSPGPFEVVLEERPDVAAASGDSSAEAEEAAYRAAGQNETITLTLEFSWTRPAGGVPPLPIGQPAFAATGRLSATTWLATANEAGQEAPR